MRIWLDTDIGTDVDDALALAYVLRHPDLELVGVSTVFGDIALRTAIVTTLLALADAAPVPILDGLGVPLTGGRHGIMLGHEGLGIVAGASPTLRVREESGTRERIDALARAVTGAEPDMVVAIGPLTNLGALTEAGVSLPPLTIMGGKLDNVMLAGMVAEVPEWNWYCDPVAVQRVLAGHDLDATIVPAEITFRTRLEAEDIERLAAGDRLGRTLAMACSRWLTAQQERLNVARPLVALHDPLTTAVLAAPDLCRFEDRRIIVDNDGATTLAEHGTPVRAATSVDAEAARAHIMAVLSGTAPDR